MERNPEIGVYHTYIDNGATGTNFHRPCFQQMLSDIEAADLSNMTVVFTDTDGIEYVSTPSAADDALYDLQGRKLNSVPQHGVYIKNGKKYVK